jgi:DeoR family transcriptional regulator, aga operon transcriptional repressor
VTNGPDDSSSAQHEGTQRLKAARFNAILERLATAGELRVAQLAADLDVSTATIRRDLEALEQRRLLTRTHGGAVIRSVVLELPLRDRSGSHAADKVRIGQAAARLVSDGSVVGLTGGTTNTEVARALCDHKSLTIVTNALNIAWELVVHPEIKLVLSGGVVRSSSYELVGAVAEAALRTLHLDIAFVGADGVSARHGITTHNEVEAHTNRVLIERAKRVVVVADRSKLEEVRFAEICPIEMVDQLITDTDADEGMLAAIRAAGVSVTAA